MPEAQTTRPLSVVIIGAGTGGLCLAHGLKRAGIKVDVFERDRTRKDGLQGYRVGIDPDGSRALEANLPPELFETFLATCAISPTYFNMFTENLGTLLSLKGNPPRDTRHGERSVSRAAMRPPVHDSAQATVMPRSVSCRMTASSSVVSLIP